MTVDQAYGLLPVELRQEVMINMSHEATRVFFDCLLAQIRKEHLARQLSLDETDVTQDRLRLVLGAKYRAHCELLTEIRDSFGFKS